LFSAEVDLLLFLVGALLQVVPHLRDDVPLRLVHHLLEDVLLLVVHHLPQAPPVLNHQKVTWPLRCRVRQVFFSDSFRPPLLLLGRRDTFLSESCSSWTSRIGPGSPRSSADFKVTAGLRLAFGFPGVRSSRSPRSSFISANTAKDRSAGRDDPADVFEPGSNEPNSSTVSSATNSQLPCPSSRRWGTTWRRAPTRKRRRSTSAENKGKTR